MSTHPSHPTFCVLQETRMLTIPQQHVEEDVKDRARLDKRGLSALLQRIVQIEVVFPFFFFSPFSANRSYRLRLHCRCDSLDWKISCAALKLAGTGSVDPSRPVRRLMNNEMSLDDPHATY